MKSSLLILPLLLLSFPSFADDQPRKIDFTQVINNQDGEPYTECRKIDPKNPQSCIDTQNVTLGRLVMEVLNTSLPSDTKAAQGDVKAALDNRMMLARLALKSYTSTIALNASETSLIENRLAEAGLPTLELYAVVTILDPALK
jgi:hypothetical protein